MSFPSSFSFVVNVWYLLNYVFKLLNYYEIIVVIYRIHFSFMCNYSNFIQFFRKIYFGCWVIWVVSIIYMDSSEKDCLLAKLVCLDLYALYFLILFCIRIRNNVSVILSDVRSCEYKEMVAYAIFKFWKRKTLNWKLK